MGVVDGDDGEAVAGQLLDHDGVVGAVASRAVRVEDDWQRLAGPVNGRAPVARGEWGEREGEREAGVVEEGLQCALGHPGGERVRRGVGGQGGVPDGGHQLAEPSGPGVRVQPGLVAQV